MIDPDYDGGRFEFTSIIMNENGEPEYEEMSFESFEEYLDWIRKNDVECGYSDEMIEQNILNIQLAYEALKTGDYEVLPEGTVDMEDRSLKEFSPQYVPSSFLKPARMAIK